MPTIGVNKRLLDLHLGTVYSRDEIDRLCFDYGLEVDDVIVESDDDGTQQEVYKIELPANRNDLLCVEGLTRSLLIFQEKLESPRYRVANVKNPAKIMVEKETETVRKFVVGAILRNISFTSDSYASFIDLQDKLHKGIGRKRTLVSMGTHDLDTIKTPVRYCAIPPEQIIFKPLNQTKELNALEQFKLYENGHLHEYLPIIRDKKCFPIIQDADGVILSMPPIINSEHSKIRLQTKNIFIEATGTDLKKLEIALDIVVTMFSQYCKDKFIIDPVEVFYPDGYAKKYPALEYRTYSVDLDNLTSKIGVKISNKDACKFLTRMCLGIVDHSKNEGNRSSANQLILSIPPTRHDILQECDIAEDLAIAYGYNSITTCLPETHTVAAPFPLNKFTDQMRSILVEAGWTEALTFTLCSADDVSLKLRKHEPKWLEDVVKISNPKTMDFQVVRNSLLPGILKTIANNKDMPLPLRLFEIQDVVFIDMNQDVKCRNERHLAAIFYSKTGAFEIVHGLLDRVMEALDFSYSKQLDKPKTYYIRESSDATYFDGRCAEIIINGQTVVGSIGILHPEVLANFSLVHPCSAFEMNIEPFL